jgi:hypothetical protein
LFFGNTYCKLSLSIDSLYISPVLNYILIIYSFNWDKKTPSLADINNGKPIYVYVFFLLYLLELVLIFAELFGFPNKSIYYYLKSIDTELTQYLWPVVGPSLNKCPKWLPQLAQTISVRVIPCVLSKTYLTFRNWIVKEESHSVHQTLNYFQIMVLNKRHNNKCLLHSVNVSSAVWTLRSFSRKTRYFLRPALLSLSCRFSKGYFMVYNFVGLIIS